MDNTLPLLESNEEGLSNGYICKRCKQIDFEAIFGGTSLIPPVHGLPVHQLEQLSADNRCMLCRLFATLCSDIIYHADGYHPRALSIPTLTSRKEIRTSAYASREGANNQSNIGLIVCSGFALRERLNFGEQSACLDKGVILPEYQYTH